MTFPLIRMSYFRLCPDEMTSFNAKLVGFISDALMHSKYQAAARPTSPART